MTAPSDVAVLPASGHEATQQRGPGLRDRVWAVFGGRRLVFPTLPAEPARLSGVLLLSSGEPGGVVVNGVEARVLRRTLLGPVLDPAPFCRWENVLSVRTDTCDVGLAPVVPSLAAAHALDLPEGGSWVLSDLAGAVLDSRKTAFHPPHAFPTHLSGLAAGLAAMVTPAGDVWSFYDLAEGSCRLAGWRWDTGIVLEALAAAAAVLGNTDLLVAARKVGDRLLATRLDHPGGQGGFPEWVDLRYSESNRRISQWVAPFNTAFIAAGLQRLAAVSGDAVYARAARDGLRQAARWGVTAAGGVAGYYFEESRQLRYLGQINDSGIFPRGLALFPEEPGAAEAARRCAGYMLHKAARPDGHIGRAWWDPVRAAPPGPPLFPEWRRHPQRVVAKVFMRGQAWALLGLTGALTLGAGGEVRAAACRLQDYVRAAQQPDGSWLYSQLQPKLGTCAKTTAALALALAEWSAATGDVAPLPAVARALVYLAGCRRPGAVPAVLGGLPVDSSEEGCIIYCRDRPVVCAYAGALELLARLAMGEGG